MNCLCTVLPHLCPPPPSSEPLSPCSLSVNQVGQNFTFVLTDIESKQRFGFCRLSSGAHTCYCILRWVCVWICVYKGCAKLRILQCSAYSASHYNEMYFGLNWFHPHRLTNVNMNDLWGGVRTMLFVQWNCLNHVQNFDFFPQLLALVWGFLQTTKYPCRLHHQRPGKFWEDRLDHLVGNIVCYISCPSFCLEFVGQFLPCAHDCFAFSWIMSLDWVISASNN